MNTDRHEGKESRKENEERERESTRETSINSHKTHERKKTEG